MYAVPLYKSVFQIPLAGRQHSDKQTSQEWRHGLGLIYTLHDNTDKASIGPPIG